MTEGLGPEATRRERLHVAASACVRFARENPALFRSMFSPALLDFGTPELEAAASSSFAVLAGLAEGLRWTGPT